MVTILVIYILTNSYYGYYLSYQGVLTAGIRMRASRSRQLITMITMMMLIERPGQQSCLQFSQFSPEFSLQKPSPQSARCIVFRLIT